MIFTSTIHVCSKKESENILNFMYFPTIFKNPEDLYLMWQETRLKQNKTKTKQKTFKDFVLMITINKK